MRRWECLPCRGLLARLPAVPVSGIAREGVMGRWMHLAIAVATSACLILGAADVFAQTWPGHPKKGSGSGVCRNQFSDPYNPNCGYEPPADAWCGPPRGPIDTHLPLVGNNKKCSGKPYKPLPGGHKCTPTQFFNMRAWCEVNCGICKVKTDAACDCQDQCRSLSPEGSC